MSYILSELKLSSNSSFDGLVRVSKELPLNIPPAEKRVIQDILKISDKIDFIFFRRFTKGDVRTSQAIAYIIDNTSGKLSDESLAHLHHTLWLNGTIPLLYVDNEDRVDILSCAAKAASKTVNEWKYKPLDEIISAAKNINDKIKQYSASRLADGTFWEDERNKDYINIKESAHNVLLEKIKQADNEIEGKKNLVARRLLLLTLLIKYLEDRGVFKSNENFFSKSVKGAKTFYHVLKNGTVENLEELLKRLESKFNGDIFAIKDKHITQNIIKKIIKIIRADTDVNDQLYFWDIYNFEHIPVEVISHIYQYFTEKGQGAVFTPILLVNLMLDQAMPLDTIKGNEKIFDPTCGSGIFLVSAFRRLVYVNQQKNKKPLTPQELIELLRKTIFGVELQEEAAYITSFSLALAVCDALRPDIIWNELQFEKTLDHNIFVGDFGERGKDAFKASKPNSGFDIILGNPPFKHKLTLAIIKDLKEKNKTIPGNQLAYYVLIASIEKYLSESGKICMIQPSGFLYNADAISMRCNFIKSITVDKIFDLISIRGLFYNADTKAIAILAKKKKPSAKNKIAHLTFRRTVSINEKICFELDHYDYHSVLQKEAVDEKYTWKANLLGGGRLVQLAKWLSEISTIKDYTKEKKWRVQVGFIIGEQNDNDAPRNEPTPAPWLFDQPLLNTKALTAKGINEKFLGRVQAREFERPRKEKNYHSPLMVIEERGRLYSGLWESGFLAYTSEFIGIKVQQDEISDLKSFYSWFSNNNDILRSCLHLCGGKMSVGRATATQKKDIMNLPYPNDGKFDLVLWEKELLNDIREFMADYVRLGQDSELLLRKPSVQNMQNYSETFLRLLNKTYPKLKKCMERENRDFRLVAFSFTGEDNSLQEISDEDWFENLSSLIGNNKSGILRTQRIIRIDTGDTLIIVKPNRLRYWIRSTAIRDVDDVMVGIIKGGE